MQITILYSLPTRRAQKTSVVAADEDTKASALEVAEALQSKGATTTLVPLSEDAIDVTIHTIEADLVVNLVEWDGHDVDLTIKAFRLLEQKGIPFTGGTSTNLALTADKQKMKQALTDLGVRTPKWQVFQTGDEPIDTQFQFPVIVKLLYEHCSIGLTRDAVIMDKSLLHDKVLSRLTAYKEPVIVEEFITGREFQVTVLEHATGVTVLPPAEIVFTSKNKNAFLTYESRWVEDDPEYKASHIELAKLSPTLVDSLTKISEKVFTQLGYRDYSRLDIRTRGEEVYVLEANTNPGLGDDDDYGMTVSYRAAGMSFADFVWEIVQSTLRRTKISP